MAAIKSALEIALERTKDLKADPKALAANAARQEGKKLAGEYLADPTAVDFGAKFSAVAKDARENARAGAFEVFASRIQLPMSAVVNPDADLVILAAGMKSLIAVPFGEKKMQGIFDQLGDAPRLKQKEQEMSARMGRPVRIDPMSDPEFAAFYKQNVGQMRTQYQDALDKAKADLLALCGIKKEA